MRVLDLLLPEFRIVLSMAGEGFSGFCAFYNLGRGPPWSLGLPPTPEKAGGAPAGVLLQGARAVAIGDRPCGGRVRMLHGAVSPMPALAACPGLPPLARPR